MKIMNLNTNKLRKTFHNIYFIPNLIIKIVHNLY